jgi:tetratricopeptide (TPR) repeat protein
MILIAVISLADWDSSMSKQSRARAAAKAAAGAQTLAASGVSPLPEPSTRSGRRGTLFASGIIVLAALMAYHNSFTGSFISEDKYAIINNPTIRHWESALSPPSVSSIGGRPLLNLTFALNYALGGLNAWGYHAVNLLIHVLAGLTLFGIVRRTLLRPAMAGLRRASPLTSNPAAISQGASFAEATLLALAVAVIWVVHPLQTEAVTYISERAESLMGLFYLLTLYCFIRGVDNRSQEKPSGLPVLHSLGEGGWSLASICCCLLGVMTKEIMVTVPIVVLLYDRTFAAGSFRKAWQLRWWYYLGLASTWTLLAHLMSDLNHRAVGFGQGVTWWDYGLTSCRSVALYLKLAFWPHPLVFDYGTNTIIVQHAAEIAPYALVLAILLAGTAIALWRWPAVGFAGAWFFVILAPASSVVPVAMSPTAENRMYLSLVAIIALVVLGLYAWIGRRSFILFTVAAVGLACLSVRRNQDYHDEMSILNDTIAKCPNNERMHTNLGARLVAIPSRSAEAIREFQTAIRINPNYAEAHNNLGVALAKIPGRSQEAISQYEEVLRINPKFAVAHYNLGLSLMNIPDRRQEAIVHFEAALRLRPDLVQAQERLDQLQATQR